MELRYCEECGDVTRVENGGPAVSEPYVCEQCENGRSNSGKKEGASGDAGHFGNFLQDEPLNLFSDQTMALRRQRKPTAETGSQRTAEPQKPKSNRLRLVKAATNSAATAGTARIPSKVAPAPAPARPDSLEGSAAPAKSAQRLVFRCLHCRSTLSIRPVSQTSKLVCPECRQAIYVTSSGRMLKQSASAVVSKSGSTPFAMAGSVVVQKQGSVVVQKQGSVRLKQGSSVVKKTGRQSARRPGSSVVRKSAVRPPSSKNLQSAKPGSVRLTKTNPKATAIQSAAKPQKPTSAFQEHEELQDPSKTAFIMETPTIDLQELPSGEAMRILEEGLTGESPTAAAPPAESIARAAFPDEGEILEDNNNRARVVPPSRGTGQKKAAATKKQAGESNVAVRVLKALFTQ